MQINEYWKQYRSKNREKLNAQRMARYYKGRPKPEAIVAPIMVTLPVKLSGAGKCIYCWSRDTEYLSFQGGVYPVCLKHKSTALSVG